VSHIEGEEAYLDDLQREFSRQFAVPKPRAYGRQGIRHQGYSDNAKGVQWNTGLDRERGVWTLGVNLEGMKYDAWPIARFIETERTDSALPWLVEHLSQPGDIELWLEREAWQVSARPPIKENAIGLEQPPVPLDTLEKETWLNMLEEAYDCLDPSHGHRGRAKQTVTLTKAGKTEKEVAPHLQFKIVMREFSRGTICESLATAKEKMLPVYVYVRLKAAAC